MIDGHGISAASETESREGNLYLVPGTPRCYKFSFFPQQENVGTELEVLYLALSLDLTLMPKKLKGFGEKV